VRKKGMRNEIVEGIF